MGKFVLVINCGSSSIKFCLMDPQNSKVEVKGLAENIGSKRCRIKLGSKETLLPSKEYQSVLEKILELLSSYHTSIEAIGHRVVHGGEHFTSSTLIDTGTIEKIKRCNHLAPLHNPANILGIQVCRKTFPTLANVAVFDTSFHTTIPKHAFLYALPYNYYKEKKIRRYGFHGTSHRYVSSVAQDLLKRADRMIIAHLGNGASVCAVKNGKSVDTSMGFTPLEGLVMGTRSGDVDPGILPFLAKEEKKSLEELITILNKESGLLGLSEISGDMRLLEEESLKGNARASLAIKVFCYRLAKYIASYEVSVEGASALIFTGGIGENSPLIREQVVNFLPYFTLDEAANNSLKRGAAGIISKKGEKEIAVIPTNEELLIAKDAWQLIHNRKAV